MPSRLAAFREGTVERRRGEREDGNEGEELKEGRKRNEKGRETEERGMEGGDILHPCQNSCRHPCLTDASGKPKTTRSNVYIGQ